MIKEGTLEDNEICPGLTWEEHADSVARFLDRELEAEIGYKPGVSYERGVAAFRRLVLIEIDGDPKEVRDHFDELERNS